MSSENKIYVNDLSFPREEPKKCLIYRIFGESWHVSFSSHQYNTFPISAHDNPLKYNIFIISLRLIVFISLWSNYVYKSTNFNLSIVTLNNMSLYLIFIIMCAYIL